MSANLTQLIDELIDSYNTLLSVQASAADRAATQDLIRHLTKLRAQATVAALDANAEDFKAAVALMGAATTAAGGALADLGRFKDGLAKATNAAKALDQLLGVAGSAVSTVL